jgi:subtilisin family serine protease
LGSSSRPLHTVFALTVALLRSCITFYIDPAMRAALSTVLLTSLVHTASAVRVAKKRSSHSSHQSASRFLGGAPIYEIEGGEEPSNGWVVFFNPWSKDASLEAFCAQEENGCDRMGHPEEGGLAFVSVQGSEGELESALQGRGTDVDFVVPDYTLQVDFEPSHEEQSEAEVEALAAQVKSSWGLDRIGAKKSAATGEGVHVYVFDSGVRVTHEQFGGRAITELDTAQRPMKVCKGDLACAQDDLGHGTHVAGIVGGADYGVAPGVSLHVMKMSFAGDAVSNAYSAFDWLLLNVQKPAILQMSFGWPKRIPGADYAINAMVAAGIVVVAAGGNSNKDACGFTWGHIPSVITVGASTRLDTRASFSNWGTCLSLFAPGYNIGSANFKDDSSIISKSGTSMAAPMVSGALALILEKNPSFTPQMVKAHLIKRAFKGTLRCAKNSPNLLLRVD